MGYLIFLFQKPIPSPRSVILTKWFSKAKQFELNEKNPAGIAKQLKSELRFRLIRPAYKSIEKPLLLLVVLLSSYFDLKLECYDSGAWPGLFKRHLIWRQHGSNTRLWFWPHVSAGSIACSRIQCMNCPGCRCRRFQTTSARKSLIQPCSWVSSRYIFDILPQDFCPPNLAVNLSTLWFFWKLRCDTGACPACLQNDSSWMMKRKLFKYIQVKYIEILNYWWLNLGLILHPYIWNMIWEKAFWLHSMRFLRHRKKDCSISVLLPEMGTWTSYPFARSNEFNRFKEFERDTVDGRNPPAVDIVTWSQYRGFTGF